VNADRHVANRGLQLESQGSVSLDMCPASDAMNLRNCGFTKCSNRLIAPRLSGSNHMGSRHYRSLKADL
jgi:hypothetical protein